MQTHAAMEPAEPHTPVVVDRLTKAFGAVTAVDGISFTLAAGTTTALLGGNGAGKTTTIAMLMGLIVPTAGSARVFGADMAHERYRVLHRMNFESPYVDIPHRLTVGQNLDVFARLYGVDRPEARIAEVAAELRVTDLIDRPYGKLSAGQKTRVSLAKAILNTPDLLLLDEPTASLDPDTADWVRARLERYRDRENATILLASHNMAEVERLASRVIMLEKGRVIADETPSELIKRFGRRTLEEVFLAIARREVDTEAGRNPGDAHA
ncbi:MAG: ABC transporter ATP-binding protein [Hyphomicrobiaceae bacterium]